MSRYDNQCRKETYITHLIAPDRVQSMLTRSPRDFDIITPGTSTVDHIRDNNYEFARFDSSQTQRR